MPFQELAQVLRELTLKFTAVGRACGFQRLHVQISLHTSVRAVGVLTRKFTTVG